MKKARLLLAVMIAMAAIISCTKEPLPNPDPKTMDDLVIKDDFSWKSTLDYELTLQGPVSRVVMITGADGAVYKKGLMTANQPYVLKITMPAYMKTVILKYNSQVVELSLSSASMNYIFE
jgi:hypothetical protein